MSFRKQPDMFVVRPPLPLLPTHYVDNTMPKRDWSKYDEPACMRKFAKRLQTHKVFTIQRQAG